MPGNTFMEFSSNELLLTTRNSQKLEPPEKTTACLNNLILLYDFS